MPVYPQLGAELSFLLVAILQTNEILATAFKKDVIDETDDIWWEGKTPRLKINGFFYPQLMHGPGKYCRTLLTGNDPYMTESSAHQAAELLLKYARQLEPTPEGWYPPEEQLVLFPPDILPSQQTAA